LPALQDPLAHILGGIPTQWFCSKKDSQKARKSRWQLDKMRSDPDYRLNQKQTQQDWQKITPGY
jgi:hypothetical protein